MYFFAESISLTYAMSALYMFFCKINIPGTENFSSFFFFYKVQEAYANYNLSGSKFERNLYIFMTHPSFKIDLNNDRRKKLNFFEI